MGGGGTLIYVGSDHFWGFKILNFNKKILGGGGGRRGQKMNILRGMKIL